MTSVFKKDYISAFLTIVFSIGSHNLLPNYSCSKLALEDKVETKEKVQLLAWGTSP